VSRRALRGERGRGDRGQFRRDDGTDVTAITNTLGASGWASTIKCIVFMNCFINNTSEFSNSVQPVVVPVNTTTTVTNVSPSTIVYGQPATATASVTAASGPAPTGTVTINAGASSCIAMLGGAVAQTSSGSCQLSPAPLVAGSPYTVTATYTANANFNGSTGGNATLTVNKADTAATLSSALPTHRSRAPMLSSRRVSWRSRRAPAH
jgi:hypothetical protein